MRRNLGFGLIVLAVIAAIVVCVIFAVTGGSWLDEFGTLHPAPPSK